MRSASKTKSPAKTDAVKKEKKAVAAKAKKDSKKEEEEAQEYVHQPKRATTAFGYFQAAFFAKSELKGGPAMFKAAGDAWKETDEAARKPFEAKAAKDKARHASQMEEIKKNGYFIMEDGKKSSEMQDPRKPKYPPTMVLPKKPMTGYFLYMNENREKIKQKQPELKNSEVTSLMADRWNGMTKEEQDECTKDAAAAQQAKHDK